MDLERLEIVLGQVARLYSCLQDEVHRLKGVDEAFEDSTLRYEKRVRQFVLEKNEQLQKLREDLRDVSPRPVCGSSPKVYP
jgi:hypothetical protein